MQQTSSLLLILYFPDNVQGLHYIFWAVVYWMCRVGPSVSVQCINCSGGCHKYLCLVKYICLTPAPPHFTHTLQFAKWTIWSATNISPVSPCLLAIMFSFISQWGINDHQQFTHCTPRCVANFPSALSAKRKYARGGVKSYVRSAAINPRIPPTRRVSSGPSITPSDM